MKLRNKKTGKIYKACNIWFGDSIDDLKRTSWKTLKEFCEDWEDYKPAEPLIKDEKVRKAVRAWAEANNYPKTMELYYNAPNFVLRSDISTIEFDKEIEPLRHGDQHTIEELCGEEE